MRLSARYRPATSHRELNLSTIELIAQTHALQKGTTRETGARLVRFPAWFLDQERDSPLRDGDFVLNPGEIRCADCNCAPRVSAFENTTRMSQVPLLKSAVAGLLSISRGDDRPPLPAWNMEGTCNSSRRGWVSPYGGDVASCFGKDKRAPLTR